MRGFSRQTIAAFFLTISVSLSARADAQPQAGKPRVFLVPARAKVYDQKAMVEGNDVTVWVKRGGDVTAKVNVGLFFVEAGGVLKVDGNFLRIVVAEGGELTRVDGNVAYLHHAKGARIGPMRDSVQHVSVHDAVTIRQSEPFALNGIVKRADGKLAAGVKVHAFTLGKQLLATRTADADGRFTFTTDEEISSLAADLSPNWADDKRAGRNVALEQRQRLSVLKGWETVVTHGPWTGKASVDLTHKDQAKLMFKETRTLPVTRDTYPTYPAFRFSPDGSLLAVLWPDDMSGKNAKAEVHIWTVAKGTLIDAYPLKSKQFMIGSESAAISPNAKMLATVGPNGIQLHVLPGGKKPPELPELVGDFNCLTFSPDGKMLAAGGKTEICVWDLDKGNVLKRFKAHEIGTSSLAFSPDNKALLSSGLMVVQDQNITFHRGDKLRLWDIATGKEIGKAFGLEGQMAFSKGLVLTAGVADKIIRVANVVSMRNEEFVILGNPATGREFYRLDGKGRRAAFSSDGRLIVTVGGGMVRYFEVLTGKEVLAVPIPELWATSVGLSPNGQTMVTSRNDGTILLWDLHWKQLRVPQPPPAFTDADMDRLWKELAGDAAGAYDLAWQLSQSPEPAVRLMKPRLQPIASQDLAIKKLVDDLNSPQFPKREVAARGLAKYGRVAEKALRQAVTPNLPLDPRRRIEALLADLEQQPMPTEELRQVRSVAVLEWIGTPAARQILTTLVAGWSEARQTQEAAAALERLGR